MKKQQQLVIGLIVVAVVLTAAIVIIATRPTATPTTNTTNNTSTESTSTDMSGKTNAGTGTSSDTTTFDASTATKVPAGQTPAQFVEAYYKAIVAGNFEAAYDFLPQAKKEGQSKADFASQIQSYGITSYKMGTSNQSGDTLAIDADEITAGYGTFTTIWTFVQQNGSWLLKSKAVAGMQ